ncbi:MAG: NUDIX hydrolase [Alphaproteobacteria bacterium]|nr:NUDIX hydrolase [Alphaproteobacteria bacterium]
MVGIGVVVFRADQVLLIRRGKPPRLGQWSLPGGLQELGETVFQAAVREVREECAVAIEPISIIDIVDAITPDADGRVRFHYTLVEVLAEWRAGAPVAGDDAMDAAWFDPRDVGSLGMWEQTTRIIAKGLAMRG